MKNKEYVLSLIETIKDDEDFLSNLVGELISEDEKETIVVKDKRHLIEIINDSPNDADLNHLDVSNVTDMGYMFSGTSFNGDISSWNVSNVTNMSYMFYSSNFNKDISQWDTSNVTDMRCLFMNIIFTGDISQWNTSNVTNMDYMFFRSSFTGDISQWDVSNVTNMSHMFTYSHFNGDISQWDVDLQTFLNNKQLTYKNMKKEYISNMFKKSPLARKKPKWAKDYLKEIRKELKK